MTRPVGPSVEGNQDRAASWCLSTSWPRAPLSAGEGWCSRSMSIEEAFEPAFGSVTAGRLCFIDHNKLFSLIKVASWSLVFRSPIEN